MAEILGGNFSKTVAAAWLTRGARPDGARGLL
jgi:hypothetical protein